MDYEEDHQANDGPKYRQAETIGQLELREALLSLTLFGSDTNLRQQAFNLGLVDSFIMQLETQLLRKYLDEESYVSEAAFVNAFSQMWIFAAYELIRTWRQRAKELITLAENGGLKVKLEHLRKNTAYVHAGRELHARQIEQVLADPSLVDRLRVDLRRIHMPYARMEALRISIAKHEVRKSPHPAHMPVYGRINMSCGSLDYEISNAAVSLDIMNRRDIADHIRFIPQLTEPTDEDIASFDMALRGPSAEELEELEKAFDPPAQKT